MMKICLIVLSGCLFSGLFFTTRSMADNKAGLNRNHLDIAVPHEVWQQKDRGTSNSNPCPKCCVYQNHSYSEGAIIEITDQILQCVRDKNVTGTNNLIWKILPKQNSATG